MEVLNTVLGDADTMNGAIDIAKDHAKVQGFALRFHFSTKFDGLPTFKNSAPDVIRAVTELHHSAPGARKRTAIDSSCEFSISIQWRPTGPSIGRFEVHANGEHNHELAPGVIHYDSSFSALTAAQLSAGMALLALSVSNTEIQASLQRMRPEIPVLIRQIYNLRQNFKPPPLASTPIGSVLKILHDSKCLYCLEPTDNSDNSYVVDSNAPYPALPASDTDLFFNRLRFALPYARDLVHLYGDVVGIDSTFGTSSKPLPCFNTTIKECNSHSHVVSSSLLSDETNESIHAALNFAKDFLGLDPQTIVTDKDMSEASAVSALFPNAATILCRFHVVDYFRRMVAHYLRGQPDDLKKVVAALIDRMVYCSKLPEFEGLILELERRIQHVPSVPCFGARIKPGVQPRTQTLLQHLRTNWLTDSGSDWAFHSTASFLTNGKLTNNGVEGYHSKLKIEVRRSTSF